MSIFNFNKKEGITKEDEIKKNREITAQQWIPIADIEKNIIYRKDNTIVGMLRIQPTNLELLTEKEKVRKVEALAEGFNGEIEGFQIFCIGRPVDLNNYLEWIQDKAKQEEDFTRKQLLKGYIKQASAVARRGDIMERRFYLICKKEIKNDISKTQQELLNRLYDFQIKLENASLMANVCDEDELLDVLSLFANPIQSSEVSESTIDLPSILI